MFLSFLLGVFFFALYVIGFIAVHKKVATDSNWRPAYLLLAPVAGIATIGLLFGVAAAIGFVVPLVAFIAWLAHEFLQLIGGNWKSRKRK